MTVVVNPRSMDAFPESKRGRNAANNKVWPRVFLVPFWGLSNELNFLPLFSEVKAAYGQRRIGKGNEACFVVSLSGSTHLNEEYN